MQPLDGRDRGADRRDRARALLIGGVARHSARAQAKPEHSLLADARRPGAGGLADETGIAADGGHVAEQPLRAPRAAGLLVGGEGQRQPSRERRLELAHQGDDRERDGEARLHVARAAPPDAPVLDGAGKRRPRPPRPRRKLVEVPRQHEIGRARAEGGDEVGAPGHGLVPLDGDAERREILLDEGREHAGVAGRVLARDLDEAGAEREQVGLPLPQLVDEPGLEHGARFSGRAGRRQGHGISVGRS